MFIDNLLHLRIRVVGPDLKHDREYKIRLGIDLFHHWYVVITFGRYALWGTSKTNLIDTQEEANFY